MGTLAKHSQRSSLDSAGRQVSSSGQRASHSLSFALVRYPTGKMSIPISPPQVPLGLVMFISRVVWFSDHLLFSLRITSIVIIHPAPLLWLREVTWYCAGRNKLKLN